MQGRRALGVIIALFLAVVSVRAVTAPENACKNPLLFFDLGDTLVDTSSSKFKKIRHMPGAHAYLQDLQAKQYRMLMIVNVPAAWGDTELARQQAIERFTAERWADEHPFAWQIFERVLTADRDELSKPHPHLFQEAKKIADADGCPAIYQGETAEEIEAANQAGLFGYRVGQDEDFFLSEASFAEYVRR